MNRPRLHPRLPLRRWLLIAWLSMWVIPVLTMGIIAFHVFDVGTNPATTAAQIIRDNPDKWTDPAWQATTKAKLAANDINFSIVENGNQIYYTTSNPLQATNGGKRSLTVEQITSAKQPAGKSLTAYLYSPGDQNPWQQHNRFWLVPLSGATAMLLTVTVIALFLGRTVVRPLGAAGDAAEQIATGDLDIDLPVSRVREVDEVNQAFVGMSQALRESLQHQSQLEQERRLFIGAIVHDLRTPLFSLRGYLEGLAKGVADTPEKRARYVAVAQEKADALERLVDDLFSYTRLEYLDQAPRPEPLDLAELLQRLTVGLQPQAAAKDLEITYQQSSTPCLVDADRHLLARALENVLDNAIRYTPNGGQLEISCQIDGDRAAVAIADSGPGIPAADLPNLFKPMYRGEASRNRRTGGAGLGLTVARRILNAHGGDLTAGNRPEGGAIFTATLPAAADAATRAASQERMPVAG